jgi:hypothetical protein
MKRRRLIASAMLCLLLAGTTLAAADPDRGRGDSKNDRGSKSEEKSKKEQSPKQGTVRRSDHRDVRVSDRHVVETRREPSRVVRERSAPQQPRTNEHVVYRTPTPAGWQNRALRGQAQHAAWDGHRARRWGSEHRTWRARGGYQGYRIPDQRYRVVFGPSHRFRVDRCPLVIVSGYPRFYYGGYWVTFIDPWPEYWADNWFAQDDCYVIYVDDGYYMTNVRYPRVRIAVSFTLD